MPMASVFLRPGVNTELTPSLNEAGVSESQLVRSKEGIVQTYGGWEELSGATVASTVRDLHPWSASSPLLGIGATQSLSVFRSDSATTINITPQTRTTNPTPNFSISSGSQQVTVVDANAGVSIYDTVFFNTPVAIGNLLLNGAYPIQTVLSTGSYTITSSVAASTSITSSGILPGFVTANGSPIITVTLPNHNFQAVLGLEQTFYAATTVDGFVIQGPYEISSVIDSTSFTITETAQATSSSSATMNSSLAQLVYYITLGPQAAGSGFGAGGFGSGGFGTGVTITGDPGTPITASDWSMDNWGEILVACPKDGAIYTWSEQSGFVNAQVIAEAPFFNGGIYISMPQLILVAWKSVQSTGTQGELIVRWCDAEDFTNWTVSNQTTAGSFRIPTGSIIVGGLQAQNYGVIWTDVDVWIQQYIGGTLIFSHTRVGSGCGLIGQHAAGVLAGEVYWCGTSNFFKLGPNGVQVIPCTVWDFIFQGMNTDQASKVECQPNSAFNEITWSFPSEGSTENDSYVKYNIVENTWDFGTWDRTAWADVSVFGHPLAADHFGQIYEHESGEMTAGAGSPSFLTGWWSIAEGNEMAFVDWVLPDFRWGTYGDNDASINITFFSANYPGDTPVSYGPYTLTQSTQYINPRIRGRLMSIFVQSASNTFWRLGRIRYRYAPDGRR